MRTHLAVVMLAALVAGCGQEAGETVDAVGEQITAGQQAAANVGLALLRKHISAFQLGRGRYPATLEELAADQGMPRVPPAPPGMRWAYDPATGQVTAERA
jgi:hypothetical protein